MSKPLLTEFGIHHRLESCVVYLPYLWHFQIWDSAFQTFYMTLMNEKLSITNFNRACILDIALKSRWQKNMGASVVLLGNSPSLANKKIRNWYSQLAASQTDWPFLSFQISIGKDVCSGRSVFWSFCSWLRPFQNSGGKVFTLHQM